MNDLDAQIAALLRNRKRMSVLCEAGCEGRCVQCPDDWCNDALTIIRQLAAERAADAADARRYRWLRVNGYSLPRDFVDSTPAQINAFVDDAIERDDHMGNEDGLEY